MSYENRHSPCWNRRRISEYLVMPERPYGCIRQEIEIPHSHLRRIEREGKALFTIFQSCVCTFPFCDVLYLSDVVERRALSTTRNRSAEHDVNDRPILAD